MIPVTHALNLYWNYNRKSLQLSCEKQLVLSFHFALSHQQIFFHPLKKCVHPFLSGKEFMELCTVAQP